MRIMPSLADATHMIANAFIGLRFIAITVAIATVLAIVFAFWC